MLPLLVYKFSEKEDLCFFFFLPEQIELCEAEKKEILSNIYRVT